MKYEKIELCRQQPMRFPGLRYFIVLAFSSIINDILQSLCPHIQ